MKFLCLEVYELRRHRWQEIRGLHDQGDDNARKRKQLNLLSRFQPSVAIICVLRQTNIVEYATSLVRLLGNSVALTLWQ